LFHIVVSAIILQNGDVQLLGELVSCLVTFARWN
jgi:hypothetical protein